ncbi:MAG: hypothetical protein JO254_00600 [Pseudolabrys sp.]|nr:hypothetical protein [Pseudolabrys sp.]
MTTLMNLFSLWLALIEGQAGAAVTNIVAIATGVAIAVAFAPLMGWGQRYFKRDAP